MDAALHVVDDHGLDGLTLAAVAQRTGVATPSLYKHVDSLGQLRTLLARRVIDDVTDRVAAAVMGRSGDDAVTALMHAYRGYVVDHPARYAAMVADPLSDPELADAGRRLLDILLAVMRGYGLEGSEAVHAVRCLRSMAHGFASIEVSGGFGLAEHVDETYHQLIRMFIESMPRR